MIAFLGWIYDWLQNLAPVRVNLALRNGESILSFEQRLHIAPERYLDNWLSHHYVLAYISSDFYDNAIFGVTLGLAAWIWWRRPDIYRPLRNELVLANLIGFTVFWLFPVAPPRMLPGFTDIVEKVGGLGSWHNTLISHADQLAAMPSMHLAWAVWCSLVVWRLASEGRWRRAALIIGIAYPLSTAWVVMATANHYLMDVLAGTAATAGCGRRGRARAKGPQAVEDGRLAGAQSSLRKVRRSAWPGGGSGPLQNVRRSLAQVSALAEARDTGDQDGAFLEVPGRLAPATRATRRTGGDDVAGPQAHGVRDVRDQRFTSKRKSEVLASCTTSPSTSQDIACRFVH